MKSSLAVGRLPTKMCEIPFKMFRLMRNKQ